MNNYFRSQNIPKRNIVTGTVVYYGPLCTQESIIPKSTEVYSNEYYFRYLLFGIQFDRSLFDCDIYDGSEERYGTVNIEFSGNIGDTNISVNTAEEISFNRNEDFKLVWHDNSFADMKHCFFTVDLHKFYSNIDYNPFPEIEIKSVTFIPAKANPKIKFKTNIALQDDSVIDLIYCPIILNLKYYLTDESYVERKNPLYVGAIDPETKDVLYMSTFKFIDPPSGIGTGRDEKDFYTTWYRCDFFFIPKNNLNVLSPVIVSSTYDDDHYEADFDINVYGSYQKLLGKYHVDEEQIKGNYDAGALQEYQNKNYQGWITNCNAQFKAEIRNSDKMCCIVICGNYIKTY